jgi:tetratricopeptide (TPR) repeat protein
MNAKRCLLSLGLVVPCLAVATSAQQPPARTEAPPSPFTQQSGAQQSGSPVSGLPQGVSREAMWYAPTVEDWKKPCLVTWQRTWDDALQVAKETDRPILVCVNMDGEIASEHYAGVRYRQPDIAALYAPYVCVIASVYRHNPRDYDDQGNRIPCPRFGTVTCGEHIAIEPLLYEQFFDGKRIAPRHICVELDRSETYDVYYAFDTASVFAAVRKGLEGRPPPLPSPTTDLPPVERVASRDTTDRATVEELYRKADHVVRRQLLQSALRHADLDQVDLLRLALFGLDVELAKLARRALAESDSEKAIDLIVEVLHVPMEAEERDLLVAALTRLGEKYPRARSLAVVQQGLAARSSEVDLEAWSERLTGAVYPPPSDYSLLGARVESQTRSSSQSPRDPARFLELAEASLALAVDPETARILASDQRTASAYSGLQFEDARRAALEAERLGASGWRLDTVLALTAYYVGDIEEAHRRAERAVPAMPSGDPSWNAMACLALYAQSRQAAIKQAVRDQVRWPAQWLADVNATYSVLAHHPFGADWHVAAHYDFLKGLGALAPASRVLDEGLARFPTSWSLHARLRSRALEQHGIAGLEPIYDALLASENPPENLEWFAGYASLVTAEYYRFASNRVEARKAYERAIAHYERNIERSPASRDSADHYVALALAGRARIDFESGQLDRATAGLLASFERKPDAASTLDGLNLSPVDTAKQLRVELERMKRADLVVSLQAGLDRLDPRHLELPAYERELPDTGGGRRDRAGPPR